VFLLSSFCSCCCSQFQFPIRMLFL
jgi:hypothetical protein